MAHAIWFRCDKGHELKVTFEPELHEDAAHDFGVLVSGGTLRSLGTKFPARPCKSQPGPNHEPCGGVVTFEVE